MTIHSRNVAFVCLGFAPFVLFGCAGGNDDDTSLSSNVVAASSSSSSGGIGGAGGDEYIPEPDGPSKLTVVNGVNDYDAIRLCFVPWPDGGEVQPHPDNTKGLAFAAASVIDTASGVVPKGTDVYVHVIAGNLDKTAGKGCAELIAGGFDPEVLVVPLVVIPRSALEAPRSLLLVPNGCLGGPGHEDNLDQVVCGSTYSLDTPTPSLVAVGMSRVVQPDALSLQAAHAAASTPTIDVRVLPGTPDAKAGQVAPSLTLGAIGTIPPFRQFALADLGAIELAQILTFPPGNAMPSSTSPMQAALERGGVDPAKFDNGSAFTMVGVGSPPSVGAGAFWHVFTWTVVPSDP